MMNALTISMWLVLLAIPVVGGCGKKLTSVPPSDPRIVGVWTLQGGDYPLTNEYRADGTVVQQVGGRTTEPSPFRIEGNLLIYSVQQSDGKISEQKEEFRLTDDTLTFIDSPTSKRIFRRNKR
ncbi:MAG: hypothetical protein JWN40_1582 [Phycisphaerales bacterium]|nr:hypothetical protein [Phycisphaerales bacterium]